MCVVHRSTLRVIELEEEEENHQEGTPLFYILSYKCVCVCVCLHVVCKILNYSYDKNFSSLEKEGDVEQFLLVQEFKRGKFKLHWVSFSNYPLTSVAYCVCVDICVSFLLVLHDIFTTIRRKNVGFFAGFVVSL